MANEDGDEWAWVGEQKFATFKAFRSDDIRFVTLQDARTALGAERARIREGLLEAIRVETWTLGANYRDDERPVLDVADVRAALDRICPAEPAE